MDIRRYPKVKAASTQNSLYSHDLQLYLHPPLCKVNLIEFRRLAFDRLKILRIIEEVTTRGNTKYSKDWQVAVVNEIRKRGLKKYATLFSSLGSTNSVSDESIRRADHISHFILRLAYCNSMHHQMWFISRELELFRLRFSHLTQEGVQNFVNYNKLSFSAISAEEKEKVFIHLVNCTPRMSSSSVELTDYYKFPFENVPDLIRTRRVYLRGGMAYVPATELAFVVLHMYRGILNRGLKELTRIRSGLDCDPRLGPLLSGLHSAYTGRDYSQNTEENTAAILPEEIDMLALQSFPPCMQFMHKQLRSTHHLHHFGRLRYVVFLKAAGLSYDHAMQFFRDEFSKINPQKFEKEYSYTISHSYGKAGKCTSYSAYSCSKLITEALAEGSCPFKFETVGKLKTWLSSFDEANPEYVQNILQFVELQQYGQACSKFFEMRHQNVAPASVICHPNQYVEESRRIRMGGETKTSDKIQQSTKASLATPTAHSGNSGANPEKLETLELTLAEDFDDWDG